MRNIDYNQLVAQIKKDVKRVAEKAVPGYYISTAGYHVQFFYEDDDYGHIEIFVDPGVSKGITYVDVESI